MPELCCLEPSSLNRPHPPHSWAHRAFTARRLIRDAFAVRERRGDPRVVPSFRCTFLPDMPPSPTPGSPDIVSSKFTMPTWSSPRTNRLYSPKTPAIRSTRGSDFGASLVCNCYGLSACSPPLDGSDWDTTQPPEAFTSRLSNGSVTLPVAGYDYDIDWTPMSAGLAPAGTAASFAALARTKRSVLRDGASTNPGPLIRIRFSRSVNLTAARGER